MIELPAIRWGEPYESLEVDEVKHFYTGESVARVHTVGAGIVRRDAKKAKNARRALQAMSPAELIEKCKQAGELFESGTLKVGDSDQSPEDFIQQQSATTGMPISMCRANVTKNAFVLKNIDQILDALTRGLDLNILARGYGEEGRGVTVSYQAQCDAPARCCLRTRPACIRCGFPLSHCRWAWCSNPGRRNLGRLTGFIRLWSRPASLAKHFACTPVPVRTSAGPSSPVAAAA